MLNLSPEAIEASTIVDLLPNLADISRDDEAIKLKGQMLEECNTYLRRRLHEIAAERKEEN